MADRRIPILLETPAQIRFLSCEPLLQQVSIEEYLRGISWLIVGGESGADYRPMDHAWARNLRDQCRAAGVPYYFKQSSGPRSETGIELDGEIIREYPTPRAVPSPRKETLFE